MMTISKENKYLNNESFIILRLLETPGIGVAKVMSIIELAKKQKSTLHEILLNNSKHIFTDKQLDEYSNNETSVIKIWQKLEEQQINVLSVLDDDYPKRLKKHLGKKTPPLLMYRGNQDLFYKTSVGFCGSRKATEKGISTTRDCVEQLLKQNIVSGYASGVDMAAHHTALINGGTTTIVLAEGIFNFKIKKAISDLWDWDRILVVSEFLPGLPWSVRNAMQRNRSICSLSNAMILIEASEKGGSIEAGKAALSMDIPLFAPVYEGMPESATGNRILLGQGAQKLLKSKKTGKARLDKLISELVAVKLSSESKIQYPVSDEGIGQLGLFENVEDIYKVSKK